MPGMLGNLNKCILICVVCDFPAVASLWNVHRFNLIFVSEQWQDHFYFPHLALSLAVSFPIGSSDK